MIQDAFIERISHIIGVLPEHVFLYWKGRVALYAYLRALGLSTGDEVIIPGLTCVVVPNAIIYTGAVPVYADIRLDTLTMDPLSVRQCITSKTRGVVIQNTFGLSADIDPLVDIAHENKLAVIDDCTHGFGGY